MPTQLYIDIMIMIKNAYFCVTKTKADNPNGNFWVVILGTDRLKVVPLPMGTRVCTLHGCGYGLGFQYPQEYPCHCLNPIAISSSEESEAETSNAKLGKFIVTCKLS